jgi:hypothetical protein
MLFPSKSQSFTAGKTITFPPWVPSLSKRGRRNTIRGFLLEASYQVDTTAAGALAGEDLAKFFQQVQVEDVSGPRRIATGEALRIMGYAMVGATRMNEMADIAASQTDKQDKAYLYVPFECHRQRGRYDCILPADLLRQIKITCPTQDTLDLVAATTIDTVDYTVYADVREDDEPGPDGDGVSFYARDRVELTQMEANGQGTIDVRGQLLAEAFAYSPGADGGASMANWTSHQLIGLEEEPISASARRNHYRYHAGAAANLSATQGAEVRLDPIANNRAAIVHYPDDDYRFRDLPLFSKPMKISATNSVSTPMVVHRTIESDEASAKASADIARAYGVKSFYMRTEGKTSRDIKGWGPERRFMAKKGR